MHIIIVYCGFVMIVVVYNYLHYIHTLYYIILYYILLYNYYYIYISTSISSIAKTLQN